MGHRMHHCYIAIYAYQDEEVDAAICIHVNARIDDFSQELTKRPVEPVGYIDSQ